MSPLTQDKIDTFAAADEAFRILAELVERAVDDLTGLSALGDGTSKDMRSSWILFEPDPDSWLADVVTADRPGHPELRLSVDDDWALERLGKPAIGAGYTIDPALHPVLSVDTEWIGRLEQGGFSFRIADGWLRCYRTLYLDHLATRGGTLGEQVRVLAQWLN